MPRSPSTFAVLGSVFLTFAARGPVSPAGAGAHAAAAISAHALYVTLSWSALAMALARGGGDPAGPDRAGGPFPLASNWPRVPPGQ
jgi:hypothetical protein